mgnify:CR=1 FL=1
MNNLAVKEVNFNGDTLIAAQDKDTQKVYVAVRWVCEGIGLTEDQMKRQLKNIREDVVVSKGVSNLTLPTNGGIQEVICIELDFLPLWLAKISITPKMKKNNPEVVEKLIQYQLKAKEVLANAFVHNITQIIPRTYKEALQALLAEIEEKERLEQEKQMLMLENQELKPKAKVHDQIVDASNLVSVNKVAKNIGIGEKKFFEFLRAVGVFYKEGETNLPKQQYQNSEYFEVKIKPITDSNGNTFNTYVTKVTGKGEVYLLNLVNKYGGAEKINGLKLKDIKGYVESVKKNMKNLQFSVDKIS